jgi:hypothetical protein
MGVVLMHVCNADFDLRSSCGVLGVLVEIMYGSQLQLNSEQKSRPALHRHSMVF